MARFSAFFTLFHVSLTLFSIVGSPFKTMEAVIVNMDGKSQIKPHNLVSFNKLAPLFKYLSQDLKTPLSEAKHTF